MKMRLPDLAKLAPSAMISPQRDESAALEHELTVTVAFAASMDPKDALPFACEPVSLSTFREDAVENSFDRDLLLASAPTRSKDSVTVPLTVGEETV